MNLRRVVIEPAQGAQCRTDLVLDPAAHLWRGRSQLLQGKRKAGHHRLLVIGVRSGLLMSRKIGASVDPDQSSANPMRGSFLPQDQRKLGRYPRPWIMGYDPNGVLLHRSGRRRRSGVDMTVRCADDCFAAAELAEEGWLGVTRIGVELNRNIGRRDLAEIDRNRERPGLAVTREARFCDVKPRPVLT